MNNKITSMSALIGAAFVASASLAPMASAADATFAATSLNTGYTLAHNDEKTDAEHKCGEGKCAAEHKKADGEHKKADGEGKCGEGKCGEGKCGADKADKKEAPKDAPKEEKKAE